MVVIHAGEFSIISRGRLVILACESPEELAFLARSLNYIVEENKKLPPDQQYTRYITNSLLASDHSKPVTKEELKDAIDYADQFVHGRNKNIPIMTLPKLH